MRSLGLAAGIAGSIVICSGTAAYAATGSDVAIDSSGRILVAGTTNNEFALARYNPNGRLDASFGHGGKVTTSFGHGCTAAANGVALDAAGRITVAGSVDCLKSLHPLVLVRRQFALARYRSNGILDRSFGTRGLVSKPFSTPHRARIDAASTAVAIDSVGRIIAVGTARHKLFAVARYTAKGALDRGFGSGGAVLTPFPRPPSRIPNAVAGAAAVTIDPAGRIVVAGSLCGCQHLLAPLLGFALARYTARGELDRSFGNGGKAVAWSTYPPTYSGFDSVGTDNSGSLIVADRGGLLLRYTSAGAIDSTFGSGGTAGRFGVIPNALVIDPLGRIVVAGANDCGVCSADFAVIRLNASGTVDTSFGTGGVVTTGFASGSNDVANAVALGPGGAIVAAGTSGFDFAVTRYAADGTEDPSFGAVTTSFRPNTWIHAPVGVNSRTRTAFFSFDAGAPNSGLQCALVSKRHHRAHFRGCNPLYAKTYKNLKPGRYTFEARGVFPSGPDPTPAKLRFRIR